MPTLRPALAGLALSLGIATAAQAAPLTLAEALSRAEEASVAVQVQQLSVEAAEAQFLSDPRAGSPSLRLGLRDIPLLDAANAQPVDLSAKLRMPLPRPWDLATASREGAATADRESAQLDSLRNDLRFAVRSRFLLLPLLRDAADTADRLAEVHGRHLDLVGQRRIEGLSTALDWLESEEERRDADDDRAVRMAAAARVEAQLRALIAWPADEALELDRIDTSAVTETPGLAEEELLDGLVDRDPDVAEARAEVRRAEARLSRSKLEGVPWLDWVEGGVGSKNGDPIAAEVGIAIDVPIYYWSRTRTREAAADVRAAQLRLADTEARAARRVVTARRTAGASLARWRVEQHHREVLLENSAPLMELADPLLKIELESRMVRAELRVQLAFVDLLAATEVARAAAGL